MTTPTMTTTVVPPAIRLLRLNWQTHVRKDAAGIGWVSPEFVAEQGQHVRILDVRDEGDLTGPLGHIPAVTHLALAKIGTVPDVLDVETCVVIVSTHGTRAAIAARFLEELGMKRVAAMKGGMTAWKALGYSCPRDAASFRRELRALAPGVGRDGRPLVVVGERERLTTRHIEEHIGDSTAVRYVKLAAFLLHGKRSCVDGRDDHGVIGTPGGDAGELLLALAAAEQARGRALSDVDVRRVLERHIDTFGRFYMHSDTHAMNHLIVDGLRKDDRIVPWLGTIYEPAEWRAWFGSPPAAARPALLEHLMKPENMGCGHLRFAMTDVDGYGVRPELAAAFLRAFHELRWAGAPELEWVILGGEHVEGAVASVVVDGDLHSWTRIPLVSPMVGGQQMFVSHPQVTSFLRTELAAFLAAAGVVDDVDVLVERIEALGGKQARATLGRLAKGLPIFELRFRDDGPPMVCEVGVV